jgi:tetratricopeptide (TPR) repeat protein
MDTEISLDGVSIHFLVQFADECRHVRQDADTATTGEVCKNIVVCDSFKPAEGGAPCSYVELLKRTDRAHHVGRANIFFSHAWTYNFQLAVETLSDWCKREGLDARACFVWFDIFTVNQHTGIRDFAYWSDGFRRTIRSIGRVVVFLQPWNDAVWLSRAWCLYEYWATCAGKVAHEFLLPQRDQAAFASYLETGGRFENIVKDVDIQRATCHDEEDARRIKDAVARTCGFAALNEAVTAGLRAWFLESADAALRRFASESDRLASDLQFSVAFMRRCMGQLPEAEDMLVRRRGELQRRMAGADAHELLPLRIKAAMTMGELGSVLGLQGKLEASVKALVETLAIQRVVLGEDHPYTAMTMQNLGLAYRSQGQYGLAIEHFNLALAIQRVVLGEGHPDTAITMQNLGGAYCSQGQDGLGIQHLNMALAIQRVALGDGHPDTARTSVGLGAAYGNQDQHGLAIEHYNQALAVQRAALGDGHPDTARTAQNLQRAKEHFLGQVRHVRQQQPSAHACNGRPAVIYYLSVYLSIYLYVCIYIYIYIYIYIICIYVCICICICVYVYVYI